MFAALYPKQRSERPNGIPKVFTVTTNRRGSLERDCKQHAASLVNCLNQHQTRPRIIFSKANIEIELKAGEARLLASEAV